MIDAARPALVSIMTTQAIRGGGSARRLGGLGFIVDSSGYILTSHQTVSGADAIHVTLGDGRQLPATLIERDLLSEVAVLKVEAIGLAMLSLGRSSALKVGEAVVAPGPAVGSEQVGAISATGAATGGNLAMTVSAGPSVAGAPLINARGEVVGIATVPERPIRTQPAIGFAVPIDRARPILEGLKARSERRGGQFAGFDGGVLGASER